MKAFLTREKRLNEILAIDLPRIKKALCIGLLALAIPGLSAQTTVTNTTYASGTTTAVSSNSSIYAGPTVEVQSGANVTFTAGTTITLAPGFSADSGSTFKAMLALAAPGSLLASSVTATSGVLTWTASAGSNPISRYDIFRDGTLLGSVMTGQPLTFSDTSLMEGSSYSYRVSAVDSAGNTASSTLTLTTPEGLEVFTPSE